MKYFVNKFNNIFLLTDVEIKNKDDTLKFIEKNNNEYSVYSFGIGNAFDEDLIKMLESLVKEVILFVVILKD